MFKNYYSIMLEDFLTELEKIQEKIYKDHIDFSMVILDKSTNSLEDLPSFLAETSINYPKELKKKFTAIFKKRIEEIAEIEFLKLKKIQPFDLKKELYDFTTIQKEYIMYILNNNVYIDVAYFIGLCKLIKESESSRILTSRLRILSKKIKKNLEL